jgi:hypothetical protein
MCIDDSKRSTPTATDLSGRWSHSSYLLDPGDQPKAEATAEATAKVWARGSLDWVETPQAGHLDTLQGTLTFPSGVTLDVRGRRDPGLFGGTGGIVLEGKGSVLIEGKSIALLYDLIGALTQGPGGGLAITGAIRASGYDPEGTGAIGIFVLVPEQS